MNRRDAIKLTPEEQAAFLRDATARFEEVRALRRELAALKQGSWRGRNQVCRQHLRPMGSPSAL